MDERTLKKLIDKLNKNKASDDIFIQELNSTVDFAEVWDKLIDPVSKAKSLCGPDSMYFLKNANKTYVGVVYDMRGDLHWFVLPNYRGKKYLKSALVETILPHIFQSGRESQFITIDKMAIGRVNFAASYGLAKSVGFQQTNDDSERVEMKIEGSVFDHVDFIECQFKGVDEQRIKDLKKKATEIYKEVKKIKSELEMKIGYSTEIEEMNEVCKKLQTLSNLVHDAHYESAKSIS